MINWWTDELMTWWIDELINWWWTFDEVMKELMNCRTDEPLKWLINKGQSHTNIDTFFQFNCIYISWDWKPSKSIFMIFHFGTSQLMCQNKLLGVVGGVLGRYTLLIFQKLFTGKSVFLINQFTFWNFSNVNTIKCIFAWLWWYWCIRWF